MNQESLDESTTLLLVTEIGTTEKGVTETKVTETQTAVEGLEKSDEEVNDDPKNANHKHLSRGPNSRLLSDEAGDDSFDLGNQNYPSPQSPSPAEVSHDHVDLDDLQGVETCVSNKLIVESGSTADNASTNSTGNWTTPTSTVAGHDVLTSSSTENARPSGAALSLEDRPRPMTDEGQPLGLLIARDSSDWDDTELRLMNVRMHDETLQEFESRFSVDSPDRDERLARINKAVCCDLPVFQLKVIDKESIRKFRQNHGDLSYVLYEDLSALMDDSGSKNGRGKKSTRCVKSGSETEESLLTADMINKLIYGTRVCPQEKPPNRPKKRVKISDEPGPSKASKPTGGEPEKSALRSTGEDSDSDYDSDRDVCQGQENSTRSVLKDIFSIVDLGPHLTFVNDDRKLEVHLGIAPTVHSDRSTTFHEAKIIVGKNDGSVLIKRYAPVGRRTPRTKIPLINVECKRHDRDSPAEQTKLCAQIFAQSLAVVQARLRFDKFSGGENYSGDPTTYEVYTVCIQGRHARLFRISFDAMYLRHVTVGRRGQDSAHLYRSPEFRITRRRHLDAFARLLMLLIEQTEDEVQNGRVI